MTEARPTDVHTEHCCVYHGCCYGDDDCTVVKKILVQSYPCDLCDWAKKAYEEAQRFRWFVPHNVATH